MSGSPSRHLIEFTAKMAAVKPERLSGATRLFEDLGMDGDDGVEFLDAFGQEFGVDMAACDPSDYFGPEATMLLDDLILLLTDGARLRHTSLTLADLEGIAASGIWFKPDRAPVPLSPLRVAWILIAGSGMLALLLVLLAAGLLLVVNFWS